jgi:hypothetical protein
MIAAKERIGHRSAVRRQILPQFQAETGDKRELICLTGHAIDFESKFEISGVLYVRHFKYPDTA